MQRIRRIVVSVAAIILIALVAIVVRNERRADSAAYDSIPLQATTVRDVLTVDGVLRAQRRAQIGSEVPARIIDLPVREGTYVTAGQVVARLDARDAAAAVTRAQQAYRQAVAAEQLARRKWQRLKPEERERFVAASREAQAALTAARIGATKTVLHTPIDGVVSVVYPEVGAVAQGTVVEVIDPSSLEMEILVPEVDSAQLREGLRTQVRFDAASEDVVTGSIVRIEPTVVMQDRTAYVRAYVRLDRMPGFALRHGMNADVDIIVAEAADVFAIPRSAVQRAEDGTMIVHVRTEDGTVAARTITPVLVTDDVVAVRDDGSDRMHVVVAAQ